MAGDNLVDLLSGKDDDARIVIARRVGQCLSVDELPLAERRGAEALAGHLVRDAAERVRRELSEAVKGATHLSRDVALKIAHDVDSVACPFLSATEVFSDEDWRDLVLTVSRGARIAAACRTSMSEGLAIALAETGDTAVAQALVENTAAPMTKPVCNPLIERFESGALDRRQAGRTRRSYGRDRGKTDHQGVDRGAGKTGGDLQSAGADHGHYG